MDQSKKRRAPAKKPKSRTQGKQAELPREKLLRDGAHKLSDVELLSIVLPHESSASKSALEISRDLLEESGGLADLLETADQLLPLTGVGHASAAAVLASREIACRLTRRQALNRDLLDHPDAVVSYLNLRFSVPDQEVLGALYLDVHNRLIADREIFRGTLSRAAVEPRPILREALRISAAGFLAFHTHPSGDPVPSTEDLRFPRRLAEASEMVGIRLVDHLILGARGQWISLRRRGVL